jgi:hypothetical protein
MAWARNPSPSPPYGTRRADSNFKIQEGATVRTALGVATTSRAGNHPRRDRATPPNLGGEFLKAPRLR